MYGKLFEQMFDGSLVISGWEAIVTFQQMIILSDADGLVDMTPHAISARTTIPLEIILKGLSELEKPDPDSRTPGEEGRRIVKLSTSRSWGWRIVNHQQYRDMRSSSDRAAYYRNYRATKRNSAQLHATANVLHATEITNTDTDTDTDTEYMCASPAASTPKPRRSQIKSTKWISDAQRICFDEFWASYWRRVNRQQAERSYAKLITTHNQHAAVIAGVRAQSETMMSRDVETRPHASTWLNNRRWEDEMDTTKIVTKSQRERALEQL
jgi:hypothetical protein